MSDTVTVFFNSQGQSTKTITPVHYGAQAEIYAATSYEDGASRIRLTQDHRSQQIAPAKYDGFVTSSTADNSDYVYQYEFAINSEAVSLHEVLGKSVSRLREHIAFQATQANEATRHGSYELGVNLRESLQVTRHQEKMVSLAAEMLEHKFGINRPQASDRSAAEAYVNLNWSFRNPAVRDLSNNTLALLERAMQCYKAECRKEPQQTTTVSQQAPGEYQSDLQPLEPLNIEIN